MYCADNTGLDNLSLTYELYDLAALHFQIILRFVVSIRYETSSLVKHSISFVIL